MEIINSKENSLYKKLLKLKDVKYRKVYNEYLLEGLNLIKDSLFDVSVIVVKECMYDKYSPIFPETEIKVFSDTLFDKLSETKNSQGILAVARIIKKTPEYSHKFCLYLDGVRDPGNLGTILRTALAAGFNDIYLSACVDAYNPKTVRSAMSAVSRLNIFDADSAFLDKLSVSGYTLIVADLDGSDAFSEKISGEKFCLIIGNEADGVSDEARSRADIKLTIPMENNIESLNAAVSAALIMYRLKTDNKR